MIRVEAIQQIGSFNKRIALYGIFFMMKAVYLFGSGTERGVIQGPGLFFHHHPKSIETRNYSYGFVEI